MTQLTPEKPVSGVQKMRTRCRICKGENLTKFLSLGNQPHCNSFLKKNQLNSNEPRWPLEMLFCEDCKLVQLSEAVAGEIMFRDYPYVSGTTKTLTAHFKQSARNLVDKFNLPRGSLIVDIGSNDGTFLQHFKDLGMRVCGVDPAVNVAEIANAKGIETVDEFFTEDIARTISAKKGPAHLITAAGVFFHIDDMDEVCRGIHDLLDDRGVLHVQAIYLGDVLQQTSFDNIYHEHMSLYTVMPLMHLFERFDLQIFDLEHSPIHGGTMLYYICKKGAYAIRESVERQLAYERSKGWDDIGAYYQFADRVHHIKDELVSIMRELKAGGKKIAAYTAPAKGNTLLNYCEIDSRWLDYAAEKAPLKIGLYTPGTHIPVIDETEAMKNPPDYFLLLAWNFKNELIQKNREFRNKGGKFIIPIPHPQII